MARVIDLKVGKSPASGSTRYRQFDENALDQLEKHYKKIARSIKRDRGGSNKTDVMVLRELLQMTWELIPIAKESYKQFRSDRGIYALNGLVNQVREVMTDLRQLRTGDKQLRHIIQRILLPNLTLLLQHFTTDCFALRKAVRQISDRKQRRLIDRAVQDMMQRQASLFDEVSNKLQAALAEYLVS